MIRAAMRILIQNCLTHEFFKDITSWTKDSKNARNFESTVKALEFCYKHQLADTQIVLKFEWDDYDVVVDVSKNCEELATER